MTHFQDCILHGDEETSSVHVMSALVQRLHLALVRNKSLGVGLTFPVYYLERATFGNVVRLHATPNELGLLADTDWVGHLASHVEVKPIRPLPAKTKFVQVRRIQPKASSPRLVRRAAKRKGISLAEAERLYLAFAPPELRLPFLELRSASTAQVFRLYIEQTEVLTRVDGTFNRYGLSRTATLPLF
jgi:CRISPR-associated endonuclease Csy4